MSSLAEKLKAIGVVDAVMSQEARLRAEPAQGDPFSAPLAVAMARQAEERITRRMSPAERAEVDHHRIRGAQAEAAAAAKGSRPKLSRSEKKERVAEWLAGLTAEQRDAVEDDALNGRWGEKGGDVVLDTLADLREVTGGDFYQWTAEDDEAEYVRAELEAADEEEVWDPMRGLPADGGYVDWEEES